MTGALSIKLALLELSVVLIIVSLCVVVTMQMCPQMTRRSSYDVVGFCLRPPSYKRTRSGGFCNSATRGYGFKSGSLETNSGSPLGAMSWTVGVGAFVFVLDGAIRFGALLAARLATFFGGALAFFGAAALSLGLSPR